MCPAEGRESPESNLRSVDLPALLGPKMASLSPLRIVKLICRSAGLSPKLFEIPTASMSGFFMWLIELRSGGKKRPHWEG